MKRRQVSFTATARRHVLRERDWWVTNRDRAEAFASELDRAVSLIATLPGIGSSYPRVPGARRLFLERIGVHIYFSIRRGQRCRARSLGRTSPSWSSTRGRAVGPPAHSNDTGRSAADAGGSVRANSEGALIRA